MDGQAVVRTPLIEKHLPAVLLTLYWRLLNMFQIYVFGMWFVIVHVRIKYLALIYNYVSFIWYWFSFAFLTFQSLVWHYYNYFFFLQLQIVMKQGLVEITTTGLISDFDDAILITREQVESVNLLVKVSTFYTKWQD